ncbi:hypothetical protein BDV10DRAFT_182788 [Aspergillus recurvatus]
MLRILSAKQFWSSRFGQNARKTEPNIDIVALREIGRPFLLPPASNGNERHISTAVSLEAPRQWIKGVQLCAWAATGVLCINILLTITAAILAYAQHDAASFASAAIYEGSCTVSKHWTNGLHFLINVLSTVMLAASNYCMQCLASPSRAEVDDAHRRRGWLSIGVPNITNLILFGQGTRRLLGLLLLLTSLPIHLIYNSAAYYALGPSPYRIAMVQANRTLEVKPGDEDCSIELVGMNVSDAQSLRLRELSKQECLDEFTQDYVYGHRALILVTSTALPDDQPLLYLGWGHNEGRYTAKNRPPPFYWMCNKDDRCSKEELERIEEWTLSARPLLTQTVELAIPGPDGAKNVTQDTLSAYLDRPDYQRLYDILQDGNPGEEQLRAALDNPTLWTNSSWAEDVDILGSEASCTGTTHAQPYRIESCLVQPDEERCSLLFSPPICLVVIGCNAVKIVCMFMAARDDRDEILLTVGDAVSSFLKRPDPATEHAALLSMADVKKGAMGWHESHIECCPCELCDAKTRSQSKYINIHSIAQPKRWMEAASRKLWLSVLFTCITLLGLAGYLLSLGVADIHHHNASSIWDYELGAISTATLITALAIPGSALNTIALTLLANTPQLLVSLTYFTYNALLSRMLLAAEYTDYANERKPLRVSWPQGTQRSTYYLSLPYRYSVPLSTASAFLHWLISQGFFFVEIIPQNLTQNLETEAQIVTCAYSPKAIIFAMIIGGALVVAALALGLRRFSSPMPLALHCSAAISAACHACGGAEAEAGAAHALSPVRWGEIVSVTAGAPCRGGDVDQNTCRAASDPDGSEYTPVISRAYIIAASSLHFGDFHCSFTSKTVVEPSLSRWYI